jgi:hypothetical protein
MRAIANLNDDYFPRIREIICLEFAMRELRSLCEPGSVELAEQMFTSALSAKLARISEHECHQYLEAA